MYILGISAFYHDSGAALIKDDEILAAAQEERFSRKKHDPRFPVNATKYCLNKAGISFDDLDAIVFYDKPLLKFERLLETYYAFSPKGLVSFLKAMPVWIKEKLFLKKMLKDSIKTIDPNVNFKNIEFLFPEHHLSHAASAFYPSPYEEAAILTIDGVGEWATASLSKGKGKDIEVIRELDFPHSVGLLYSAFTYYLGFKVNSGEYKLMGLAPYGNPNSENTRRFVNLIKDYLVDIKEDGSIWLNQEYFNYAAGLRMVHDKRMLKLFGLARREEESEFEQIHCDLAFAIQEVTEEIVLKMAKEAMKLAQSENICMAGGVALNCVANGKILSENVAKNLYVQPAAGDAGGALGAALAAYHIYYGKDRHVVKDKKDGMLGSYLGAEYSNADVEKLMNKFNADAVRFDNFEELSLKAAEILSKENVVGWMQGRAEFGPRALGNRSILGDARSKDMQKKLNLKIKYREGFRPFAPSVLEEDADQYFEMNGVDSPYMLIVNQVNKSRCRELPADYHEQDLKEKLYFVRSDIPSITHLDFSARVQTVSKETNPRYHRLIEQFKGLTGYGLVINTSFNVRGEPIVNSPEDAYRCFMRTEMDYLVINDFLFKKENQPEWQEGEEWRKEYPLD